MSALLKARHSFAKWGWRGALTSSPTTAPKIHIGNTAATTRMTKIQSTSCSAPLTVPNIVEIMKVSRNLPRAARESLFLLFRGCGV